MLGTAGTGAAEERVYRLPVELRDASMDEIVQRLRVPEREVASLLPSLYGKGLVERPPGDSGMRYAPAPPDVAPQPLLTRAARKRWNGRGVGWSS
ncbi:helix-turn-helix domain-containing protein [Streptomyces nitrosporeus]|nr:helix-turn-helix domain-containing protein [Streptomyces nitrosporeus]GGZ07037.1 hypothetical protein GCM10010327_42140 [Streptomyces nitrosporeus]